MEKFKYKEQILGIFNKFLNAGLSKRYLIEGLYRIEIEVSNLETENLNKDIWFKFFKDDTEATTIANIDIYLDNYIVEKMQIAINNPNGFKVFYS